MSIDLLKSLTRQRWMIAVLAQFQGVNGLRHAVIMRALPISRESLSRTLEEGVKAGWIIRDIRHGHPLRPEYRLSANGAATVDMCAALMAALERADVSPAGLGRWSLPVIWLLDHGETRFNAIERALGEATPRAVTQCLKAMTGQTLIIRHVVDGYPPVTSYALTAKGKALAAALKL